jgi:hypothetical protein
MFELMQRAILSKKKLCYPQQKENALSSAKRRCAILSKKKMHAILSKKGDQKYHLTPRLHASLCLALDKSLK